MHSMTGFGRSEGKVAAYFFTVEVKSVNHRYLDARFRIPQALSQFELPMNEILRKECERGSFDVSIRQRVAASDTHYKGTTKFVIDETALKSFLDGAQWLSKTHKVEKNVSLDSLVQTNRIFVAVDETEDASKLWDGLKSIYQKALKDLKTMRKAEGDKLKHILLGGALEIERLAEKLEKLATDHPKRVEEKLQQRIKKWDIGAPIDKGRLETEIAFLAERADITEEIDRLRAHGKEFGKLLEGSEKSIGRKLEFLTQELLREANTVASKADMLEVTQLSLTLKSKIEKLREQVQNVE